MMIKNVVLLGHKDHGKSTLIGSLLISTGSVSQERIDEAKRISKELGKRFEPGFMLDAFAEERRHGLTIDTTRAEIQYKGIGLELIDVPGHEELIKNMLTGASNASFALLVVSANKGEGITSQTRRHLFIARMLGIRSIVVAVNKMDTVNYSKAAFESIAGELAGFLAILGFGRNDIAFVPVSAYNMENLVKRSGNMKWYRGKTLIELIYEATRRREKQYRHTRILLQNCISDGIIGGRVVSGTIMKGDRAIALPAGIKASIGSIVVDGKQKRSAKAGESVALRIRGAKSMEGMLLCRLGDEMPIVSDSFDARIFITGNIGKDASVMLNGAEYKASIRINTKVDTTTGLAASGTAGALDAAEASFKLGRKAAFEKFEKVNGLGRFTIYSRGRFAGIGIIH